MSLAFLSGNALNAEQANAAHTHIGHVMDGWGDTPDGQGLLPAAIAEATIAAQHAAFAAKDPSNLDAMKLHAAHVLQSVDPEQISNGPGTVSYKHLTLPTTPYVNISVVAVS